jgi:hypothetical protein
MLQSIQATGGTIHGAAVRAFFAKGVRVPAEAKLVVIIVGDEGGEEGARFAQAFAECGYRPDAMALIVSAVNAQSRGMTVRQCAAHLRLPYSEVQVAQFDDPYQVPRVLKALLDAPPPAAGFAGPPRTSWVDKVMATPILQLP